jgi:hypothetical protein
MTVKTCNCFLGLNKKEVVSPFTTIFPSRMLHSEMRKDLATLLFVPGEKLSLEKLFFENAFFFFRNGTIC